jgi:FtsP/CotA-like multicopper oxidase with cupredoxin domain
MMRRRDLLKLGAFGGSAALLGWRFPNLLPTARASGRGWKDTRRINPHEVGSIIVRFEGYTGRYVFHCHMLEHAEHMMMGQFEVVAPGGFAASAPQPSSAFVCPLPAST